MCTRYIISPPASAAYKPVPSVQSALLMMVFMWTWIPVPAAASAQPSVPPALLKPHPRQLMRYARSLRHRLAKQKRAGFSCQRYMVSPEGTQNDLIKVPCIGRVEESLLLAAVAAGAEIITLYDGDCGVCERKRGSDVAICASRQVNLLLEKLGVTARLRIQSQPLSGATLRAIQAQRPEDLSRRAFFTMLWNATGGVAERITVAAAATDIEPRRGNHHIAIAGERDAYLPMKWQILAASLKSLQDRTASSLSPGDLWADITIGDNCNGCRICAESCPTGALAAIELDGKVGVSFTAAQCTGCNVCVDVCCRNCIISTPSVDLKKIITGSTDVLVVHDKETVEDLMAPMENRFFKVLGMTAAQGIVP